MVGVRSNSTDVVETRQGVHGHPFLDKMHESTLGVESNREDVREHKSLDMVQRARSQRRAVYGQMLCRRRRAQSQHQPTLLHGRVPLTAPAHPCKPYLCSKQYFHATSSKHKGKFVSVWTATKGDASCGTPEQLKEAIQLLSHVSVCRREWLVVD